VLPRAWPPRAKGIRLALASGRSPDLVSQMRVESIARLHRRRPSRFEISGSVAGSFESITVAGPRGNLTRFPILPDVGAPEAQKI
jgi:hypothetical protein